MHPLPLDPDSVKGFMPASEGAELYRAVSLAPRALPCLEIGSYCGKSTIYLGGLPAQRPGALRRGSSRGIGGAPARRRVL